MSGYLARACRYALRRIGGRDLLAVSTPANALHESGRLDTGRTNPEAKASSVALERVLSALYSSGVRAFAEGKLDAADALFACYLEATGQPDLVKDRATTGCPHAPDYENFEPRFREFLAVQREAWRSGNVPLPEFLRRPDHVATAGGAVNRLFFILPQYIFNNDRHIECHMKDHLFDSAVNAGLEAYCFFGDNILYPRLGLDPAKATADLARLRAQLSMVRPDVIVFDANFAGEEVGLNADFVRGLKEEFGVRLIGFMGDVWGTHWIEIANYWSAVADMLLYNAPDRPFVRACSFSEKMYSSPYPVNSRYYFKDHDNRFDLSFLGSHAYLRPFWLGHAIRAASRLDLKTNIREHERTCDCPSVEQYAEIIRRSRVGLNFSSRDARSKIITGRVWEVLHTGSLLLEEDNEEIKYYFTPFIHYVPFENAAQLELLIEFFHKNPNEAEKIGQCAAAFCAEHYSAASIWNRVLSAAAPSVFRKEKINVSLGAGSAV
ncbi:MAG TPA: glycosyltransferase [Stellaceae bacterium]|nr:glycosyltransferase [Stellaceae bacterium]